MNNEFNNWLEKHRTPKLHPHPGRKGKEISQKEKYEKRVHFEHTHPSGKTHNHLVNIHAPDHYHGAKEYFDAWKPEKK